MTATQPLATVPVILSRILTFATSALVSLSVPRVSSFVPSSSVSATVPISTRGFSSMHLSPALVISPPQPSPPTAAPSFVQPPMAPKPAASSTQPHGPVIALLRELLARREAEFAVLDEALLTREDLVMEPESSLAKSSSGEVNLRSQVSALQTDLDAARADLTASQLSVATNTFELDKLCADSRHLTSQVPDLTSTPDGLRLELSSSQAFILSAALNSLRSERDRHLSLLCS